MRRFLSLLLILSLLLCSVPFAISAAGGNSAGQYAPDSIIVKMRSPGGMYAASIAPMSLGVACSNIELLNPSVEFLNPSSGTGQTDGMQRMTASVSSGKHNNIYLLTLEETGTSAVKEALEKLSSSPFIEYAEPNYIYQPVLIPNDTLFGQQYALGRINAPQAWDITTGSKNIVIGIIDTGLDGRHEDITDNLWYNPAPGSSGYPDDIHGFDFGSRTGGIPADIHGHGTMIAGIIGAKGNNALGITGVNWNVSLAYLGVGHSDGSGSFLASNIITALNYATIKKIPITSNSYGGTEYSRALEDAIRNYPGLFVAAAGNSGQNNDTVPFYPASYNSPNIIAVASSGSSDKLSYWSNYGAGSVHIAAPGEDVLSTFSDDKNSNTYRSDNGTSFSCPYVAGVAGLVLSAAPSMSTEQLKSLLISTSRRPSQMSPYGFGIVDAGAAVHAAAGRTPSNWRYISNHWYYYINGIMQTGWVLHENAWYYLKSNGVMAENEWITWNGSRYYLKQDGMMAENEWLCLSGIWYWFKPGGAAAVNEWLLWKDAWYYLKSNGIMSEDEWIKWNGAEYYLKPGGAMAENYWLRIGDTWRYQKPGGAGAESEWVLWNNLWYYLKPGGAMAENEWLLWRGVWYFLKSGGVMAADEAVIIDGIPYGFDAGGAWTG